MRPINFSLAAGDEQTISQSGDKVFVYELATGSIKVVIEDGDQNVQSFANQGTKIYAQPFRNFTIRNESSGTRTGVLLVGDGDIDIPIPGIVEVVDGGKQRTDSHKQFMLYGTISALGSNYNHVELYNAAGSGEVLYVTRVTYCDEVGGGGFRIGRKGSALSTTLGAPKSKRLDGGSDVAGRAYMQQHTGFLYDTLIGRYGQSVANETVEVDFTSVTFRLDEGEGLVLASNSVNRTNIFMIEYYKEDI